MTEFQKIIVWRVTLNYVSHQMVAPTAIDAAKMVVERVREYRRSNNQDISKITLAAVTEVVKECEAYQAI